MEQNRFQQDLIRAKCQTEINKLKREADKKIKQLEEEYKSMVVDAEIRKFKTIISRNEVIEILDVLVPNEVAIHIASYHPHPIQERIGKDKLVFQYNNLCLVRGYRTCRRHENLDVGKGQSKTEFIDARLLGNTIDVYQEQPQGETETLKQFATRMYYRHRDMSVEYTNRRLNTGWRLHRTYPFNKETTHLTKYDIKEHAEYMSCIELSMSWTKKKMIEEFYKRTL